MSSKHRRGTAAPFRRRELRVTNKKNKRNRRKMRKSKRKKKRSQLTKGKTVRFNNKEKTNSLTRLWRTNQKSLSNVSKKQTKIAMQLLQSSPNACKEAAPTTQIPLNNLSQKNNQSSRLTTSAESTQTVILVWPALKNTSIILKRNSAGFNAVIASLNHAMVRSNASWTTPSLS